MPKVPTNEVKTFELRALAGPHKVRGEDADGDLINDSLEPGDRIRSSKPMDKMFPNKFFCVEDEEKKNKFKAAKQTIDEPVRPVSREKLEEDRAEEEYAEEDLDETLEPKKKAKKEDGEIQDDSQDENEDEDGEFDPDKYGKDVTEDVEGAEEKDLKVYFRNRHYYVFDADGTEPLHDSQLTKKDMTKFIADYKG